MKKTILIILTMMVVFTMLLSTNSMVYATENLDYSPYTAIAQTSEAIPRWTNCNQCSFVFNVLDPGEAHINVSFDKYEKITAITLPVNRAIHIMCITLA